VRISRPSNPNALLLAVLIAIGLATGLAGCGKKGDLEPPEGKPSTYPRTYPSS